jgi:hypothetical protein
LLGANALEEDVRKLQHQKKHADTRITEHPSMREATINYDEPVVPVESQNETQNKSQSLPKVNKNKAKKTAKTQQSNISTSENVMVKETKVATTISKETTEKTTPVNGTKSTSDTTTTSPSTSTAASSQSATNWTAAQQAQLERALQTYPPNWKGDGDRWDKIAAAVEDKTKRECKLRVKVREII